MPSFSPSCSTVPMCRIAGGGPLFTLATSSHYQPHMPVLPSHLAATGKPPSVVVHNCKGHFHQLDKQWVAILGHPSNVVSSPSPPLQQVLLRDATPSPTKSAPTSNPPCHVQKHTCQPVEPAHLDSSSTRYSLDGLNQHNVVGTPSLEAFHSSTSKAPAARVCKHSGPSIQSSLLAAAEDGITLAAQLLHHFKESLYSILPQSLKSKISNDWDSMLSSSLLEGYMDKMKASASGKSSWLTNSSNFKRVVKKVNRSEMTDGCVRNGCHHIEGLLDTIESFERAGLIGDLESVGFVEEACILRDRAVFYGLFARLHTLNEVSSLLCFMRLEMRLPFQDTWSLACSDARFCKCLKQIRGVCNFHDKIKTFAWKLDKLELCANEADSCKETRELDASLISNRLVRLIGSQVGPELEGIRIISYLDTAVSLLLHHVEIFGILQEHRFGEP